MLRPDATQEEIDAHNLHCYREGYYNRGRHLLIVYTFLFSALVGGLFEYIVRWGVR